MTRHGVLAVAFAVLVVSAGVVHAQDAPAAQPFDQAPPPAVVQPSAHAGPDVLYPDPTLTPGVAFDGVTVDEICVPGYTRSVRDVTSAERARVYAEYSVADLPGFAEVDHFIPLELGGSNDIANLWVEPYARPGAHEKDRVENYLHDHVCDAGLSLGDAQHMIVADWYAVYLTLSGASAAQDTAAATPQPATMPTPLPPTEPAGTAIEPPGEQAVTFIVVTGGPPGGRASVTVQTAPDATCSIQYTTPAGTKSTAQGQGATVSRATDQDGHASWSWDIGPSTRPGTATVTATCSTGTATTSISIG